MKKKKLPYVIVRANPAGILAGYLEFRIGTEATLTKARRLYYWCGATNLSGLAATGTTMPEKCKFPVAVPRVIVTGVAEILETTPQGAASLMAVPEWRV